MSQVHSGVLIPPCKLAHNQAMAVFKLHTLTRGSMQTCQLDLVSLHGRLPMYLPSISRRAFAPSTASEKLTKP